MLNRKSRINEFLIFLRDIALENPKHDITSREVYNKLIYLGIKELDDSNIEDLDIEYLFDNWIKYFSDNNKIDVYVSENRKYFCQFKSSDGAAQDSEHHIKIYIPLDLQHIEVGAKLIFNFLSSNNISHISKIGKHVRFDSVVVRLINKADAKKFLEFLSSNDYIQEGLNPPNPFVLNEKGIPIGYDGNVSLNFTLASLIALYIRDRKKNKKLEEVSFEDFYSFVAKYYQNVFVDMTDIERLEKDFKPEFKRLCSNRMDEVNLYINYMNVIKFILENSDFNYSYDKYLCHYEEFSDSSMNREKDAHMKTGLYNRNKPLLKKIFPDKEEIKNLLIQKVNAYIYEILSVTAKKYGETKAIKSLIDYVENGVSRNLTRDENLRSRISKSNFRRYLNYILKSNNMSLEEYLEKIGVINNKGKEETLNNAIIETYTKYGSLSMIKKSLINLLLYGENTGFTRDNNVRLNLNNNVSRKDAIIIVKSELGEPNPYNFILTLDEAEELSSKYVDLILQRIKRI